MSQMGSLVNGNGNLTVPVTVPNGGTGQVTLPAHTVLLGEGTSAIGNVGPGAANTILMGTGAGTDPVFGSLVAGSNITLTNGAGTITISSSGGGGAGSIVFTADSASTATTDAGTLNIFGDSASGSSVLGDGIKTITIANVSATTSQKGVLQLATGAQAIAGTDTEDAVTSDALKSKLGTQILNGIAFGNGTSSAIGWTSAGGANTVLLGNGGVPTFGSVPNAALANSSVTLNSGNNITVTGGGPLSLGGVASFNVTGTTNHAVLVGNATASINSLALGTNGQVLIGSTGADPQFGTITSGDGSITITGGAGTLALSVTAGSTTILTITGDTGGALSPTAGNFNILGTAAQGITTAGAGSTLTLSNTDWTTAQKGVGVLSTNAQAIDGSGTTQAVTPAALGAKLGTQATNGVAFGAGTTSALSWTGNANNGVLISGATGTPQFLANGTTGQVLLATTGSPPSWGSVPNGTVATGGTGVTSFTPYAVVTGGTTTTGPLQQVSGLGTSGQVLTSNGAGTLPTWQAASTAGALTLITSVTTSGSSEVITSGLTYDTYFIVWSNVYNSAGNGAFQLQLSSDGGATYKSTGYIAGIQMFDTNSSSYSNSSTTVGFYLGSLSTTSPGSSGSGYLFNCLSSKKPSFRADSFGIRTDGFGIHMSGGYYNSSTLNVNAIKLISNGGASNFAAGTFSIYGVTT